MNFRSFWLLVVVFLFASTQALAVSGSVLLGFGDSYVSAQGKTSTHRGIDVAMGEGDSVPCPLNGRVRFAGRVPGTDGGSVLAVTVDTDEGSVTMLPLEALSVKAGDVLSAGATVGQLAASGDISSREPHLHLGLKHGDLYVDPTALLSAAAAVPDENQPAQETAAAPQGETQPAVTMAQTQPFAAPVASVPSPAVVVRLRSAPAPAAAAVATAPKMVRAASPSAIVLGRGVSLAPSARTAAALARHEAPSKNSLIAAEPVGSSSSTKDMPVGAPRILFFRTLAGVGAFAILLLVLVFTVRRSVVRRVATQSRMSDRFGIFVAAPANR